jgi:nucleotide-binding universal stress UspA family protein
MLKLLATLDGSPLSEEVLPLLNKLTAETPAEVILLSIVDEPNLTMAQHLPADFRPSAGTIDAPAVTPSHMMPMPPRRVAENTDQAIERAIDEGKDRLEGFAGPLRQRGIRVDTQVEVDQDAARAISAAAEKNGVDMIVMATHGRSGLSAMIQGSVAAKVVSAGVAPVLLVKPKHG